MICPPINTVCIYSSFIETQDQERLRLSFYVTAACVTNLLVSKIFFLVSHNIIQEKIVLCVNQDELTNIQE